MPKPPTKAQAIADVIARHIDAGDLAPGSWLPSERQLAQIHGADRSTIRRALRLLEQRRLVVPHPGLGVKVREAEPVRREASDITAAVGTWRGFHVSATQAGREPYTDTTVREVAIDPIPARWLGVPTGTLVLERARIQGIAGEPPIQVSTTWILPEITERLPILRQINTGPGGMLSRIEELGFQLRFEDAVSSRLPSPTEQDQLQIQPDQPVLTVWRRCYDQHDRVLEVTCRVIAAHRHELIYRYDTST
jgi:GntR family transcriptional regulator